MNKLASRFVLALKALLSEHPRVWTLELLFSRAFIEEVSARLLNRLSEHKVKVDRLDPSLRAPLDASSQVLQKLVIEEFQSRIRVHMWLSASEAHNLRYNWFDLDISRRPVFEFDSRGGRPLWEYLDEGMVGGALTLSVSWEHDSTKDRGYYQLTLWVYHQLVRSQVTEAQKISPDDIIFKIALDPARLCDEEERLVYVEGKGGTQFRASDVEPFPYDEDHWHKKSGDGSDWRWSWDLRMKTFSGGI